MVATDPTEEKKSESDQPSTMNTSQENIELARRKIAKAFHLMKEYCDLAGKGGIVLSFAHHSATLNATPDVATAHVPTRHPHSPLPQPGCVLRSQGGKLRDPVYFEEDRRKSAAKSWCDRVGHHPNLNESPSASTRWRIHHHPSCASNFSEATCDCGRTFLVQIDRQVFAVNSDGSLDRISEPEWSASFLITDGFKYIQNHSWDIDEMTPFMFGQPFEYIDMDDTVIEGPTPYKAPKLPPQ